MKMMRYFMLLVALFSSFPVFPAQYDSVGIPFEDAEGQRATFHAAITDFTPPASATDSYCITGSATRTVKVTRVQATADATNVGVQDFYIFFRTVPDVGGAASSIAAISHDTNNATATANIYKFTVNPTIRDGTLVAADHYALPAAASTGYPGVPWIEDFGIRNTQPLTLRGINQWVCLGFNGKTIAAGLNIFANFEWIEE